MVKELAPLIHRSPAEIKVSEMEFDLLKAQMEVHYWELKIILAKRWLESKNSCWAGGRSDIEQNLLKLEEAHTPKEEKCHHVCKDHPKL